MSEETTIDEDKSAGLGVQVIARAASVLRALEGRPDGLSLGADRAGSRARPLDGAAHRRRARDRGFRDARPSPDEAFGSAQALRGSPRRSARTSRRSCIRISSRCAMRSAKRSICRFCRAARPCSSIRFRGSSDLDRAVGDRRAVSPALHRERQGDPRLLQQAGRGSLIDKSVAEHPEHPLSDRAKLLRELDAIRRKHLAFDLGEHDVGISAVGAAVLDPFGRPVAVSIPAPTHRFNAKRDALAEVLTTFREKIAGILG